MNILRHVFSFKLDIALAVVAFLGAALDPPDARALTKCPCVYTLLYSASIAYAKSAGFTNKVDRCFDLPDTLTLVGGLDFCGSFMSLEQLTSTPFCTYLFTCADPPNPGYSFEPRDATITLTPREVKACRSELLAIAKLSGILPCQEE